ncbi:MAG: hypothetical protein IKK24_00500, partial [Clostridia bacterium]|nr:hypothetical protein [Clostridia bacterium]
MRFKNILTYFYFCATIAVVLRTYQVFFTIDSLTGFFKPDYKGLGTVILLALGVILLSLLIVSFTVHRKPLKLPTVGYLDGGISFILGLSIFYDIMNTAPSAGIPSWQRLLLIITGVFAGIFFCLYALKCFKKFETPAITYIIPSIFWAVKLIYSFTAISSLALITNNIILLATNIFVLLFMFEFAKLANNLDANNGYKKILATGLTAVTLCAISSIPG